MTSGKGCAEDAVCLAVCVGWRMAELYNRKELPGPARRRDPDDLPGHLPGFGEMSGHEKSCALAAHMGADLASLGCALGLEKDMPSAQPVLDALRVPGHRRDDVRTAVLNLYLEVRDLVAGSNVSAALGFGLGRMLADTVLLPIQGHPEILAERFEAHRLANAFGWLDDLDSRLPRARPPRSGPRLPSGSAGSPDSPVHRRVPSTRQQPTPSRSGRCTSSETSGAGCSPASSNPTNCSTGRLTSGPPPSCSPPAGT
jgi:hypothetical protein